MQATEILTPEETARRKAERPFDLAYQAGQVSRVSRQAEGTGRRRSPWSR